MPLRRFGTLNPSGTLVALRWLSNTSDSRCRTGRSRSEYLCPARYATGLGQAWKLLSSPYAPPSFCRPPQPSHLHSPFHPQTSPARMALLGRSLLAMHC